jgi:hypothetical protein
MRGESGQAVQPMGSEEGGASLRRGETLVCLQLEGISLPPGLIKLLVLLCKGTRIREENPVIF